MISQLNNLLCQVFLHVCVLFLTISEDVCVAAQEAAQCVAQLAGPLFSLQGSANGLLGSLDHQH